MTPCADKYLKEKKEKEKNTTIFNTTIFTKCYGEVVVTTSEYLLDKNLYDKSSMAVLYILGDYSNS